MATYRLTPSESVTVVDHAPAALVVEATYGPAGRPPPAHLHPVQDERFTVLDGTLSARVDGQERTLHAGDVLDVPRGADHTMWNADPQQPAHVRWETRPAGRTEDWFAALDAAATTNPVALAPLVRAYDDTFRLAGPRWLLVPALAALAIVARLTGRAVEVRRSARLRDTSSR